MSPLLSIITVVRNAPDDLRTTLNSVKSQTCQLYEQIVIDGASTDNTVAVANDCGIKNLTVISEPDRGIYDAMNKGLALAQGDYVMFLNSGDTLADDDTIEALSQVMMDLDYPGIVYGQTRIVDVNRQVLGPRHFNAPEDLTLESFAEGMVVCHQAFVVLRKITSPFNTRFKYSADYDWCIRCLMRSRRNAYVDRILIDYLNEGTTTHHHKASLVERFKIMAHYYGIWNAIGTHLKKLKK